MIVVCIIYTHRVSVKLQCGDVTNPDVTDSVVAGMISIVKPVLGGLWVRR